jgi:hypothetical protein
MKNDRSTQINAENWNEYCLLVRRIEWLEIQGSAYHRENPGFMWRLNEQYSDVSIGLPAFCEKLQKANTK